MRVAQVRHNTSEDQVILSDLYMNQLIIIPGKRFPLFVTSA